MGTEAARLTQTDDESLAELLNYADAAHKAAQCNTLRARPGAPHGNGYPNLEKITHGYNIFKGSPYARTDSGFSNESLFTLDWASPRRASDGKYYSRDTSVSAVSRCTASTQTQVTKDEHDLQTAFSNGITAEASGSYGGFEASFRASTDYAEQSREMRNGEQATATATAKCVKSRYAISSINPPCMSANLVHWINHMKAHTDGNTMNNFFNTFGTHAIKGVDVGAMYVSRTEVNR